MKWLEFLTGGLAVWRLTHLLVAEDGPFELVVRLRQRVRSGSLARLMDCFYCLSLWIAIPFALLIGGRWQEQLILWPALSAAAIAWETTVTRLAGSAQVWEDSPPLKNAPQVEERDELLWKSPSSLHQDAGIRDPGTSGPTPPSR
jgi:hypothetical protein